jgi:hypothetical protein
MARINIPAYCPTCGAIFPTGFLLSDGINFGIKNCQVGPCPNGHMGHIMDGTFDIVKGVVNLKNIGPVSQEVLAKIKALAKNAESGNTDPKIALDEIAEFLPHDLAAAIKKLGAQNPLVAIIDPSYDHQHSCWFRRWNRDRLQNAQSKCSNSQSCHQ